MRQSVARSTWQVILLVRTIRGKQRRDFCGDNVAKELDSAGTTASYDGESENTVNIEVMNGQQTQERQ